MPSSVARSTTLLLAAMCTATGAAGNANCLVSVFVSVFQMRSEVSVASSSVVPAKARLRAMAPFDCGRIAVVPLAKFAEADAAERRHGRDRPVQRDAAGGQARHADRDRRFREIARGEVGEQRDFVVAAQLGQDERRSRSRDERRFDRRQRDLLRGRRRPRRSADHSVLPAASLRTK